MQEQVGWDPIYLHRELSIWVRLYFIYLCLILLSTFYRVAVLVRQMRPAWTFPSASVHPSEDAKQQAKAALTGRMRVPSSSLHAATSLWFSHYWESCRADVQRLRRWALLIILSGFTLLTLESASLFQAFHLNKSFYVSLLVSLSDLLTLLGVGLLSSLALMILASYFETILTRRKLNWDIHKDILKMQSDSQPR